MSRNKQFRTVRALKPSRSAMDLSYSKILDCDMGKLIPVFCDEVVPGDTVKMSNSLVVRLQPLLAPILHDISITTHYFFCPYRLMWDQWEDFISGGKEGDFTGTPPLCSDFLDDFNQPKHSIWDYLGLPIGNIPMNIDNAPTSWPIYAYNWVYNEFYRDQNLQDEVELSNIYTLRRAWTKDYFTSSLPFIQRGTIPALPVVTEVEGEFDTDVDTQVSTLLSSSDYFGFKDTADKVTGISPFSGGWGINELFGPSGASGPYSGPLSYFGGIRATNTAASVANTTGDLNAISTAFNVNDVRLAFQISKWQERNARTGVRHTEFLHAHFGVSPRDDRLQRPEYIGGTKSPVIISEVLQTSSSDTESPQGNLAGHGISVDQTYIGKYRVEEFGLIIGIMSIMPKPSYMSQGVPRQWRRLTRFDHYFREFANLSEQAILNSEIFVTGTPADNGVFGFQGRYDEMRVKNNMAVGNMRDTFAYWHLSRSFDNLPRLNKDFIECNPDPRIFAVPSEPGFIVNYSTNCLALRPMPFIAEPGMIDHF